MPDTSICVKSDTKIPLFAMVAFNLRKQPPYRLGVVPDVRTGPVAAADALPCPESAVLKAVAGAGGKSGGVGHSAVEEPIRQG